MELRDETRRIEDEWTAICGRITRLRDEAVALIARGGEREVELPGMLDVSVRGFDCFAKAFGYEEGEGVYLVYEDDARGYVGQYLVEDALEACLAILHAMEEMEAGK